MIALFASAFVTLFVVIDPAGCGPIFAGLTRGAGVRQRRAMALRATLVAAAVLLVFALVGEGFLRLLEISLDSFRVAGGIMLFLIALEMVFERRTSRRAERVQDAARGAAEAHPPVDDVSIFPMAIPMIAGPGSIATVMLLMSRAQGPSESAIVLAALGSVLVLTLAALLAAGALMRVLGAWVEAMISRVLGVILAALAAQYVIDGIRASFA